MPVKSRVRIKKKPRKAERKLRLVSKRFIGAKKVKVGLPANSNAYPDGTSVIMVGIIHEFGLGNVPERSFLRATLFEDEKEILLFIRKLAKKVFEETMTMDRALGLLGQKVTTMVKDKITDLKEPALTSRPGGNPLVLTSHLRKSITYIVED